MAYQQATVVVDANKKAVKDGYTQAVADLTAIKDASSMTNAQAVANLKRVAEIQLHLLKFVKSNIIGG